MPKNKDIRPIKEIRADLLQEVVTLYGHVPEYWPSVSDKEMDKQKYWQLLYQYEETGGENYVVYRVVRKTAWNGDVYNMFRENDEPKIEYIGDVLKGEHYWREELIVKLCEEKWKSKGILKVTPPTKSEFNYTSEARLHGHYAALQKKYESYNISFTDKGRQLCRVVYMYGVLVLLAHLGALTEQGASVKTLEECVNEWNHSDSKWWKTPGSDFRINVHDIIDTLRRLSNTQRYIHCIERGGDGDNRCIKLNLKNLKELLREYGLTPTQLEKSLKEITELNDFYRLEGRTLDALTTLYQDKNLITKEHMKKGTQNFTFNAPSNIGAVLNDSEVESLTIAMTKNQVESFVEATRKVLEQYPDPTIEAQLVELETTKEASKALTLVKSVGDWLARGIAVKEVTALVYAALSYVHPLLVTFQT